MTALRLVTFNTHHGVGDDGRHDLVRVAELLQRGAVLEEVLGHRAERADHEEDAYHERQHAVGGEEPGHGFEGTTASSAGSAPGPSAGRSVVASRTWRHQRKIAKAAKTHHSMA